MNVLDTTVGGLFSGSRNRCCRKTHQEDLRMCPSQQGQPCIPGTKASVSVMKRICRPEAKTSWQQVAAGPFASSQCWLLSPEVSQRSPFHRDYINPSSLLGQPFIPFKDSLPFRGQRMQSIKWHLASAKEGAQVYGWLE